MGWYRGGENICYYQNNYKRKNYGHYYAGKIASENQDNTFLIHFDDGDVEDNVEWGRIEPLNESSEEVQAYISQDSEAENELIEAFKIFDASNSGTIPAKEYLRILTETGDDPIPVEDVMNEFILILLGSVGFFIKFILYYHFFRPRIFSPSLVSLAVSYFSCSQFLGSPGKAYP